MRLAWSKKRSQRSTSEEITPQATGIDLIARLTVHFLQCCPYFVNRPLCEGKWFISQPFASARHNQFNLMANFRVTRWKGPRVWRYKCQRNGTFWSRPVIWSIAGP